MKPPKTLGKPGKTLWKWAADQFDLAGVEPLLIQACELTDRLADVRLRLGDASLQLPDRARLISAEVKLVALFERTWRTLGLADAPQPEVRRGPGRPTNGERGL